MEKTEYGFEDFIANVNPDCKEFTSKIHELLMRDGYKIKVESKASGFFVSYSHPKTKRSMLNFLFRKKGLLVRVYADNLNKYKDFINGFSGKMAKEIEESPVCKRLINPGSCNPKCVTGYDFSIGGKRYQKCRYSCFQFEVVSESMPVLSDFIENERRERLAATS